MDDTTQPTWHFFDHWIDRPDDVPTHAEITYYQWNTTGNTLRAKTTWRYVDCNGDTFETTVTKRVSKTKISIHGPQNSSHYPPTCSACGPQDPCAFSKSQLRKGDRARCRKCVTKSLH